MLLASVIALTVLTGTPGWVIAQEQEVSEIITYSTGATLLIGYADDPDKSPTLAFDAVTTLVKYHAKIERVTEAAIVLKKTPEETADILNNIITNLVKTGQMARLKYGTPAIIRITLVTNHGILYTVQIGSSSRAYAPLFFLRF